MIKTRDHHLLHRAVWHGHSRAAKPLPWASKLANRGLVWPIMAAALAARRNTRTAGLSGAAAVGVASTLSALVAQAVQRRRPARPVSALGRSLGRPPGSPSFPSTHTANAWAFAVATASARPPLGIVTVPAALAIGISRVTTGHHYPSDVLAGTLLGASTGALVAAITKSRLRPRPDDGKRARSAGSAQESPLW